MTKEDALIIATRIWGHVIELYPVPSGHQRTPKRFKPGDNGWFVKTLEGSACQHTLSAEGQIVSVE